MYVFPPKNFIVEQYTIFATVTKSPTCFAPIFCSVLNALRWIRVDKYYKKFFQNGLVN